MENINVFEKLEALIFAEDPDINPKEVYSEIVMARDLYDLLIKQSSTQLDRVINFTSVFGVPITVQGTDTINSMSVRTVLKKQ